MGVTSRQLNRATLGRQLLLERERLGVVEAVRRVVGLQAQEPVSPYLALWNRLDGFDPASLDEAFAEHALVKASLMRITLHAVDAEDYTAFHEAMLPNLRASRLHDRRFKSTGLTIDDADALVPELVEFASKARTKAEIEALLAEQLGAPPDKHVWWALRTFAPLMHTPNGGAWAFGRQPTFRAAPTEPARSDTQQSLQRLIRRYLEGFGPASVEDFGQFALQKRKVIREALQAMRDTLTTIEDTEGRELFDIPGVPLPDPDTPAPPRLLPMWDSVLLAYSDRSRVIPDEYRKLVIRNNGDVLPTLLVDGYVAGVWRTADEGIEALAFRPLTDHEWEGLASEAADLLELLARDPAIYRRHAHWWDRLPRAEVRVLPG